MEAVNIVFNDETFDRLVHEALPQASTVTFAVKESATVSGRAGVVVAFDVQLPDGTMRRAQATLTLRSLQTVLGGIVQRYDGAHQARKDLQ